MAQARVPFVTSEVNFTFSKITIFFSTQNPVFGVIMVIKGV